MARDVLLEQRPDRGTWDLVRGPDGNPVSTESEQHAVLTQLYEQRGAPGVPGWVWDSVSGSGTPGTHGSLLAQITEDTTEQRALAKAYVQDALQPLVDEGGIVNVVPAVSAARVAGRIDASVSYDTPGGQTLTLPLPLAFP